MKKLLLIPVIAVSLLTGCDSSSTVTINDWFKTINEKTTWGRYALLNEDDLYEGDNYDFDLYTANLIKENVKDAKIKKKNIKEFDKGFKVSYEAKNSYNEYSEFKVFVYEDKIATSATAYYTDRNPSNQRVVYELPEDNLKAIIEGAYKRRQDIRDQNNKDHTEARENASINNFFKQADEAETKPSIIRNKYYGVVNEKEDWREFTLDYSIMEDIKGLEYEELDNYSYNSYQTPSIVCTLSNNTTLRIFNWASGPVADIEYRYKLTYYPYYNDSHEYDVGHIGYSLSPEKTQALIDKTQPK